MGEYNIDYVLTSVNDIYEEIDEAIKKAPEDEK